MPTLKQNMATAPSSWYPTKGATVGEIHKLKKSDFIMFKIMTAKEFGHNEVGHQTVPKWQDRQDIVPLISLLFPQITTPRSTESGGDST